MEVEVTIDHPAYPKDKEFSFANAEGIFLNDGKPHVGTFQDMPKGKHIKTKKVAAAKEGGE